MRTLIKALVPKPLRSSLSRAKNYVRHKLFLAKLFGRYASLIPPLEFMHDGPVGFDEFKANGEEFFRLYTKLCDLKPHERMLDVGCGIGRKTFLLTTYLNNDGSYEGIDIVKTGINWCTERITPKYPQFKFQQIDVCNRHYNPSGKYKASEYRFPFADESFDFVVLCSVFTHMVTEDMERYLSEVSRVLKTGGRCLITFFLVNESSLALMRADKSSIDLDINGGPCWVANARDPEEVTGYTEDFVRAVYEKYRLKITEPVHYGGWCGRKTFLSYQDLILAFKEPADTRIRDEAKNRDNLHFELARSER
jgi:ubiquinone/menaquinone biosynthesis C-methylase UbiE